MSLLAALADEAAIAIGWQNSRGNFARDKGVAIVADEVYQHNLYGVDWVSFARVLGDATDVPLFSLHSTSKGDYGECGHRGGYLEVRNPLALEGTALSFLDVLYKRASVSSRRGSSSTTTTCGGRAASCPVRVTHFVRCPRAAESSKSLKTEGGGAKLAY